MDAELSRLVSERCGCEVDASFIRRKEFRFAWGTRDGHPVIQVSDYLRDAPDQVLTDFGEMLVRRSRKQKTVMPASFCEYVATDGFVISRRPVYIDRSRNLLRTDIGDHAFIPDSIQRLLDAGLLTPEDIRNSWFSWTRRDNLRRLGFCSTLFRVVGISSALDSPEVPDAVRDGYRPGGRTHDAEFRRWERSYPGWKECENALRTLHRRTGS